MITVQGYVDDVAYALRIDPDAPPAVRATSGTGVIVACEPPAALALLEANVGEPVSATPTGPYFELDLGDAASVLTALYQLTDVRIVDGDVPDLTNPDREDPANLVW